MVDGRGGWHSYNRMDNKTATADRVMPEPQGRVVGDVMPARPESGSGSGSMAGAVPRL